MPAKQRLKAVAKAVCIEPAQAYRPNEGPTLTSLTLMPDNTPTEWKIIGRSEEPNVFVYNSAGDPAGEYHSWTVQHKTTEETKDVTIKHILDFVSEHVFETFELEYGRALQMKKFEEELAFSYLPIEQQRKLTAERAKAEKIAVLKYERQQRKDFLERQKSYASSQASMKGDVTEGELEDESNDFQTLAQHNNSIAYADAIIVANASRSAADRNGVSKRKPSASSTSQPTKISKRKRDKDSAASIPNSSRNTTPSERTPFPPSRLSQDILATSSSSPPPLVSAPSQHRPSNGHVSYRPTFSTDKKPFQSKIILFKKKRDPQMSSAPSNSNSKAKSRAQPSPPPANIKPQNRPSLSSDRSDNIASVLSHRTSTSASGLPTLQYLVLYQPDNAVGDHLASPVWKDEADVVDLEIVEDYAMDVAMRDSRAGTSDRFTNGNGEGSSSARELTPASVLPSIETQYHPIKLATSISTSSKPLLKTLSSTTVSKQKPRITLKYDASNSQHMAVDDDELYDELASDII